MRQVQPLRYARSHRRPPAVGLGASEGEIRADRSRLAAGTNFKTQTLLVKRLQGES